MSVLPARVQISVYSGDVHPPVFTLTMYNFTVVEDVPTGTLVGEVEATVQSSSSSSSSSAGIQYSIDYSSRDWFRIVPSTGAIYTKASLDRETQQFVLLSVSAQVSLPQNLSSTAQVNFTLLDVNDNSPYFLPSSVLPIEVKEDTILQYPIYIAQAMDRDAGLNGTVLYHLDDNNPEGLFHIDDFSGEVYVQAKMDYERHHHYEVVIIAEDQGTAGQRSSSMTLTVSVKDVNDNYPVFSRNVYDFYVSEDQPIGYEFGNVSATDADSDHNGRISYSLEASPYLSVFGIFTVQGVLSLRDNVDRESLDLYTMTVVATDHGTPQPLSSTASIRIHINDTNDNDPEFSRSEYKFSILENQPPGSHIGRITATDRDAGDNRRLQYYFSSPQSSNFSINTDSGEITALVPLDREEQEEYTLRVYVADSGQPSRSDTAVIKIRVMDENDNRPEFQVEEGDRHVEVWENRPKDLDVVHVLAVDRDAGENGTVSFELDPENSDADALHNFCIHPSTGMISTLEVLDYETKSEYYLQVLAQDNGYPRQSQSIVFIISVRNDNEGGPLFHAREISIDVVENLPIGTSIGRVQDEVRESMDGSDINFFLVGGNVFELFAVDTSTGVIQTVREVDYEQCSSQTLSIQAVDLSAAFPQYSNISVNIQILDLNDNAPIFDNDPIFLRMVRENSPVNHMVHTFIAADSDSGPNGTLRYTILSQSASGPRLSQDSYFQINAATGELSLARPIDYEQVHIVSLVIQAEDDCPVPSLALSSQVTAVVLVQDVNDNRPEFRSTSEVHVLENEAVGYPVVLVVAVDGDSNQEDSGNNVVRYSIVSGNEDGKFRLDQTTGLLTIYEALDRETRAGYVLNVSAEDSGVPRMAAYQELRVFLEDVNDNAPLFGLSVYQGNVKESSPAGSQVAYVTATDNDQGSNGNVTYSIPPGIAGDKFAVNAFSGEITTTEILDREEKEVYSITVYATDSGHPPLQDITTVVVRVSDINDHAPAFEEAVYQVKVPENHPQNDIITVIAADLDVGANADVTYSITGGNDDRFEIDPRTGELSCQGLDRETHPNYTLTITATDSGTPESRSGSTQVQVKVLDLNDNSPQFSQTVYTTSVAEDVAQGVTVMRVSASDPDEGSNGELTYSLLGNDTEGFFSVNSSSGDIITSGAFDREKNASFEFLLVATDGGGSGPRNSTARIRISIADVNDNAPKFRQVPYKTTVSPNTTPGHTVLQMRADDPDVGDNGTVTYQLLSSTDSSTANLFDIHPSSGTITTRTSLSQATGYHSVLIVAADQGTPALSTTGVAEIIVGDNSSVVSPVRFEQDVYSVDIVENAAHNTDVTTVQASYTGSGDITYNFVSGNELSVFSIDAYSGLIRVADPVHLDFESTPHLKLVVSAEAGGHQAYAPVQVNLKDVNDNAPKFAQTKYVASVWENNQPQTFVTQVWAKDADSGINGTIGYKIIYGNDYNTFEVFPADSGIVRTNIDAPRLDREILRSHLTLTIEAQDLGYPPQRSTCRLHITFVDENDNAPTFPIPGPGPVYLAENERAGHVVAVVTATDVDLNPVLVYDFTAQGNPENRFSIDRCSGTVRLASSLDHETRSHYTLALQVTDGRHTASTTLEVYVTDVNDNAPHFMQSHYLTSLAENTPAATSVLRVLALDADDGPNADVTYTLLGSGASSGFMVDSRNGTIFTTGSVQLLRQQSVVQLVVAARDGGSPSLSSVATVQIHITDINDRSPRFLRSNYSTSVKESTQRGTEILVVSAEDTDDSADDDTIHYVLSGPSASTFYIEPSTGKILLSGMLDHERIQHYHLKAMAVDRGTPPRNTTVPVVISILDDNDNAPEFRTHSYFVVLEEDTYPLGKVFLMVNATDADKGLHAELEYSLSSGNSSGAFGCTKNGGLFLLSRLDYEAQASHRLVVRAVDCVHCENGAPRLSAFVTVLVNVTDVNEYPPQFPVTHYYGTMSENLKAYLTVFQVHANDKDGGEYGEVNYTILSRDDKNFFGIDPNTGHIVSKKTFNYEDPADRKVLNITIRATDAGGLHSTVPVTITITDEDEFPPKFLNKSYTFKVPGSAKKGAYVGTVSARDADGGSAGRVVYTLDRQVDYFQIEPVSGNISVAYTLHEAIEEKAVGSTRRKKRALGQNLETLIVRASSGMENSMTSTVLCVINIDRSCAGCQTPLHELDDGLSSIAIALIVLVCILVPAIIIIVLLIFICQKRRTKGVPTSVNGEGYVGREGTVSVTPPPLEEAGPLPAFKSPLQYNNHIRAAKANVSDFSEQSHNSASSGRGSVEVEDDDEIRRINANSYLTNLAAFRHKTMPDSGIQQDDDTPAEPVAVNHQEYLARLGIDSSKIGKPSTRHSTKGSSSGSTSGVDMTFCVESAPPFGEGGGGEGGLDLDHFTDTDVDEEMVMIENTRRQQQQGVTIVPAGGAPFQAPEPQQTGALSHVINNEEEYSGSYNWDYLLDWGPQYQPLAHVFSEIAKLKDESVTPKKTPVKTVPQRRINGGQGLALPQARIVPPPIITNAPPPLGLESSDCDDSDRVSEGSGVPPGSGRAERGHKSSGGRAHRPKTGASSLPTLPRSPISYEPSLNSSALTPSFTPSVSPLGTHTPSFSSSAVSGQAVGPLDRAPGSSARVSSQSEVGGTTPAHPVSSRHTHSQHHPHLYPHLHSHPHPQTHPHHHRGHYNSAKSGAKGHWTHSPSSESDREFRI